MECMGMKIAVLTIVKGRKEALLNLIKGLSLHPYAEMELIIVHMNEENYPLPLTSFPIRSFTCFSEEVLPLAKARNLAISCADAEYCIFLDVDCIPGFNFIALYVAAFNQKNILWSGQVRYLRSGFPADLNNFALQKWSNADPIRSALQELPYELFWSLNFGCSKKVFYEIGGFDEKYQGYGAEDTDFAFTARKQDVKLGMVAATAFHQPHASYDPPLNHLQDIIKNAIVFHQKWNRWPMEGWLSKFMELGYVFWNADQLTVLKDPAPSDISAFLKVTA